MQAMPSPMGLAIDSSSATLFPGSVLVSGASYEIRRVSRTTYASQGAAFGSFAMGSIDGVFGNLSANNGGAGIEPGPMAFDSSGNLFVMHVPHNKVVRIGKLQGSACSLALPPSDPAAVCRPGTFISWSARTCLTCPAGASRDVFPFSSYCQDAAGSVIDPDAGAAGVAGAVGISVGGIVAGSVVVVALLAMRAYYVVTHQEPTGRSRRAKGGGAKGGAKAGGVLSSAGFKAAGPLAAGGM